MTKLVIGLAVGVFVGAFAVEMLNRKKPGLLKDIQARTKKTIAEVSEAFAEGYHGEEEIEANT